MRLTRLFTPPAALVALSVALGAVAGTAGCKRTKAPYDVNADPYLPAQVQIADKGLARKLAFQNPRADRDEANLLHVTVPVRAATNRPQIVQYRFTFFDETGRPLPGGEYRTETLESNTFAYLQGNSTTPQAADYQVEIRPAR